MKRSNRTLVMMLMAMGCITLLILSNVLYTMTSARHFRTGMNVKEYKDGDIVKTEVLKAKRGSILDRSGEILAKDEDTYTIIAVLSKTRISVIDPLMCRTLIKQQGCLHPSSVWRRPFFVKSCRMPEIRICIRPNSEKRGNIFPTVSRKV